MPSTSCVVGCSGALTEIRPLFYLWTFFVSIPWILHLLASFSFTSMQAKKNNSIWGKGKKNHNIKGGCCWQKENWSTLWVVFTCLLYNACTNLSNVCFICSFVKETVIKSVPLILIHLWKVISWWVTVWKIKAMPNTLESSKTKELRILEFLYVPFTCVCYSSACRIFYKVLFHCNFGYLNVGELDK